LICLCCCQSASQMASISQDGRLSALTASKCLHHCQHSAVEARCQLECAFCCQLTWQKCLCCCQSASPLADNRMVARRSILPASVCTTVNSQPSKPHSKYSNTQDVASHPVVWSINSQTVIDISSCTVSHI
jgi:hypothetical protein